MYSLNNAYKEDFFYYNNGLGEINLPGKDFRCNLTENDLPLPERDLYTQVLNCNSNFPEYVIRHKGTSGIGICVLIDTDYLVHLSEKAGAPFVDPEVLRARGYAAMVDLASELEVELQASMPKCRIYAGFETDPDGHELLVFVPQAECENIQDVRNHLANVYQRYEMAFLRQYQNFTMVLPHNKGRVYIGNDIERMIRNNRSVIIVDDTTKDAMVKYDLCQPRYSMPMSFVEKWGDVPITSINADLAIKDGCCVPVLVVGVDPTKTEVTGKYISVWDGGFEIATLCKINLVTGHVFDIQVEEDNAAIVETLDAEFVELPDGTRHPVCKLSEREEQDCFFWADDI